MFPLTKGPPVSCDVFISHAHEDRELAFQISRSLEASNFTTWYYERDSLPGPTYIEQIAAALENAGAVLVLISVSALKSPHVRNEVTTAYELGKPFLPVLLDLEHDEFKAHTLFRQAIGAATSVSISAETLQTNLGAIIAGTKILLRSKQWRQVEGERVDVDREASRPFAERLKALHAAAVLSLAVSIVGAVSYVGCHPKREVPLDRMEAFRQQAEDCLSSVDWPEAIIPVLVTWEREALKLQDAGLRTNLVTRIRLMNEKARILAKPAITQLLEAVGNDVASARDRESAAGK